VIRIFIVCKNDFFSRSIEPILNEYNIAIAGTCMECKEAVDQFANCAADLVLLDANWINYDLSGTDILNNLLKFDSSAKVVFVTNSFEAGLEDRLRKFGAFGYFYRTVNDFEIIIDCITKVYHGEPYFTEK